MDQEIQSQEVENQEVNEVVESTPQLTEVELKAMEQGWRPKDEYEGDPDKWIDAAEFVRRAPLFEKIESLSREAKESRKVIQAMKEHIERVRRTEYDRALQDLRAEKEAAFEDGNAKKIIEIDERIAELKAEEKIAAREQAKQASAPDPDFISWVNVNPWYGKDAEMSQLADSVGMAYKGSHPSASTVEVLEYVSKRIRTAFPEKFKNSARAKPGTVEGSGTPRVQKKDTFELSDEERRVMKTLVRAGALTEEEYINDLKKVKGIK